MPWGKNDYVAAALIICILAISVLIGLYLTGRIPASNNSSFNFRK